MRAKIRFNTDRVFNRENVEKELDHIRGRITDDFDVRNEVPGGVKNGTNKLFRTNKKYRARTTRLFLNGLRQVLGGGNDYSETTDNTFTFSVAPTSGDKLTIDYIGFE